MSDNSVTISYVLLGGCGIYGLSRCGGWSFSCGCFGLITLNSATWLIRRLSEDLDSKLDRFNNFVSYCQLIFALPCITTVAWLANGYQKELAYAHTIVSVIPLLCFISDRHNDRGLIDLILAVNAVSLGVVSYLAEDLWGVATAVVYGCTHFMFYESYGTDKDVYNYMLSAFTFLAAGPL